MATTSSDREFYRPARRPERSVRWDLAGIVAAIALVIQLCVGFGVFFSTRQQVIDLKEFTNQRITELKQDTQKSIDKVTEEVRDLRNDITGKH